MTPKLVDTFISPDLLDTVGKSFNFRHGAGIAEWLKNSLDNYLRRVSVGQETRTGLWPAYLNLVDAPGPSAGPNLVLIDFGGTTYRNVKDFFLHWGDTGAATLGRTVGSANLTGGHGNGGKFYMRQMWKEGARFLTWCDESVTSLVVEKRSDGKTGYWEKEDEPCDWRSALSLALDSDQHLGGSDWVLRHLATRDPALQSELDAGKRGLTVIVGKRAQQVLSSNDVVRGGRWDHQKLVDSIKDAPQARRPISELAIALFVNGEARSPRLSHEEVENDSMYPPIDFEMPNSVLVDEQLATNNPVVGRLVIHKAAQPLTGRLRERQSLTISDKHGNPVAAYRVPDLPLPGHSSLLAFYFGELQLAFDGLNMLVQNDRVKLTSSPTTDAILEWVAERLWQVVQTVEKSQRDAARRNDLQVASVLNEQLNRHAQRFLEELQTHICVDFIENPNGGGPGLRRGDDPRFASGDGKRGTNGSAGTTREGDSSGGQGHGGTLEVSGTGTPVRRSRFPRILLSGLDVDPSSLTGGTRLLTERHPPLEQDDSDKLHNVWWINTEHVFAKKALEHGGARGANFKSYHLNMVMGVVQIEALRLRQRRESELSLDVVENELTDACRRFLGELPISLIDELLS